MGKVSTFIDACTINNLRSTARKASGDVIFENCVCSFSVTQTVEVSGEIEINTNPVECNGRVSATIACHPTSGSAGVDSSPESELAIESISVLSVGGSCQMLLRYICW